MITFWVRDCGQVQLPFTGRKIVFSVLNFKLGIVNAYHPQLQHVHRVSTIPMRCNILNCCKERGDQWAFEVENRVQGCFDLEAMYHDSCLRKFSLKRNPIMTVFATGQSVINWFITKNCFWNAKIGIKMKACWNGLTVLLSGWTLNLVQNSTHLLNCIQQWLGFLMELNFTRVQSGD